MKKVNGHGNEHLRTLKPFLDETGLPWEAKAGKRHIKIYIIDRLALCISRGKGGCDRRLIENGKASIRRISRELKCKASN